MRNRKKMIEEEQKERNRKQKQRKKERILRKEMEIKRTKRKRKETNNQTRKKDRKTETRGTDQMLVFTSCRFREPGRFQFVHRPRPRRVHVASDAATLQLDLHVIPGLGDLHVVG